MKHLFRLTLLGMLGVLVAFTGCANKKKKQINALEAQVGEITNELVRLDQSIQETRASVQNLENTQGGAGYGAAASGGTAATGIYRTPSGFELPSAEIQQALKGAGYYTGSIDGKIGPSTREAAKSFQRDNGLDADGVIGRRTWAKLKAYTGATTTK